MKTEIMIAVLALLCIGSMAAAFVLWAKLDEQKKTTAEEYNRRWDEISRAASLEQDIEFMKGVTKGDIDRINRQSLAILGLQIDKCKMQDRLSAILCPHNDHVWKDGRCAKCGRVKDA